VGFDVKAHLRTLVEAHGVSAHEAAIRALVREAWQPLTDAQEVSPLGSLIGIKRATRPMDTPRKIMLAAHMDEIGLIVGGVIDGFIRVQDIHGSDNRLMLAQPVIVHAQRGATPLKGVIAAKPPHLTPTAQRSKYPPFTELLVDVGLPASRVSELVQIGDIVTMDAPMVELGANKVAGKAMDDRACVAAVTVCLQELQHMHHAWDVYAVATVQEETGLIGAKTSAFALQPDLAIALDVSFAPQSGIEADNAIEMGGGTGIGIGANFHTKLTEKIRETAKRHEMKLQDDIIPANSGTDAWSIQVSRAGVPTALLEVPIRNMHSPVETLDIRDVERTGRLMAHFIAQLDADFMQSIAWDETL
jgi:tetrahedral aminopeptidase